MRYEMIGEELLNRVQSRLHERRIPVPLSPLQELEGEFTSQSFRAWIEYSPLGLLSFLPEKISKCEFEDEYFAVVRGLPPADACLLQWAINLMADVVQEEQMNNMDMNARRVAMVFALNTTQMSDSCAGDECKYAKELLNFLQILLEKNLCERGPVLEPTPVSGTGHSDDSARMRSSVVPVAGASQTNKALLSCSLLFEQCESEEHCFALVRGLPPADAVLLRWAINVMSDLVQEEPRNNMNARRIARVFAPNMIPMPNTCTEEDGLKYTEIAVNFLQILVERTLRERGGPVLESPPVSGTGHSDDGARLRSSAVADASASHTNRVDNVPATVHSDDTARLRSSVVLDASASQTNKVDNVPDEDSDATVISGSPPSL